ncbi:MAG: DUF4329 domain-containing protein [Bacteroidales bacterium]|nr:DUF4329 domain-containing protein [Bacteroidales bacterium]
MIYASNNGNLQIENTDFAGGRINLAQTGSMASGTNSTGSTLTQDIHYFHTDHLGSVRAITDNSGSVIEQNAYYPFGSRHTFGNTYAQTTNRFKFNGKEEQTTGNMNYLDYGARMYDSYIGRWTTQDPLAEKYYSQSPYNYCVNNPVMFVDPDGRKPGPGDLFASPQAAAIDWGLYYNGASIINKREKVSIIYKVNNDGIFKYGYTKAITLGAHGGSAKIKNKGTAVATIHSHGNYNGVILQNDIPISIVKDNEFSSKDKENSQKNGLIGYLATPNGSLLEYEPNTDIIKVISKELPSDINDPSRLNNIKPIDNTTLFNRIINQLKEILMFDE